MDNRLHSLAALAAATLLAQPLAASPYDWLSGGRRSEASQRVGYRDLDLSRPDGLRALERRLAQAAHRLCVEPEGAPLELKLDERACLREAMAAGRRQLVRARAAALAVGGAAAAAGD